MDKNDIPGSFERLCDNQTLYCYPVKELVMMGYDWEPMVYLFYLEDPSGADVTSAKGGRVFQLFMMYIDNEKLMITWPVMDY